MYEQEMLELEKRKTELLNELVNQMEYLIDEVKKIREAN